ncbi:hypothetical protein DDZ13_06570 [Coraliomargarita sinensis]|uniref:Viral coat protein P2 C-terminal domain-containing protein n=2 Tax=Coraliomargarita sinensis TaxID=2174842 RepID=A0A317ZKS9_9BACT|nr:hypothetical protein DDZ13_06570 [Coraliomargarita sinensis]
MPLNRRYHGLKLFASVTETVAGNATPSTDPADVIDYVKLIVNGVVIRDLTPAEFVKLAQANFGGVAVTDHIPIFFSDPTRATVIGEEATAWDMFGQNSFVIEIKLKSGTTNPQVTTQATFDFSRNLANGKPFLNIVKQHSLTYNAPQGEFDIVNLPVELPIQRLHITPSTGTVSDCEVSADGETVFEASKAENDALHADYGIDSPFGFSVIFDYEQQFTSPLKVQREMNLKPKFSAANNASIVLERIARGYA